MAVYKNFLGFQGCSMRGVKYRQMDPAEHAAVSVDAAADLGKGATVAAYTQAINGLGARRMLVEFTDPVEVPESGVVDLEDPKMVWKEVDSTTIETGLPEGFTAKDASILEVVYRSLHETNQSEIEAFMGKARTVRS